MKVKKSHNQQLVRAHAALYKKAPFTIAYCTMHNNRELLMSNAVSLNDLLRFSTKKISNLAREEKDCWKLKFIESDFLWGNKAEWAGWNYVLKGLRHISLD